MGFPVGTDQTPIVSFLNIGAAATVVKNGAGFIYALANTTGPVSINDTNLAGGATAANLICTVTAANVVTQINFKFNVGLLVTPTAGVASVSYE